MSEEPGQPKKKPRPKKLETAHLATVYFQRVVIFGSYYYSLSKVEGTDLLSPSDRSRLSLMVSEYQVYAGDIAASRQQTLAGMKEIRQSLRSMGFNVVTKRPGKRDWVP